MFTSPFSFLGPTSAKDVTRQKKAKLLLPSSRKEVYGQFAHFKDSSFPSPPSRQGIVPALCPLHSLCNDPPRPLLAVLTGQGRSPAGRHWVVAAWWALLLNGQAAHDAQPSCSVGDRLARSGCLLLAHLLASTELPVSSLGPESGTKLAASHSRSPKWCG